MGKLHSTGPAYYYTTLSLGPSRFKTWILGRPQARPLASPGRHGNDPAQSGDGPAAHEENRGPYPR